MRNLMKSALVGASLFPATAMAQDQVTLNWALWDQPALAYYGPLVEAYEAKNPNVKIEYTDLGSADYNQMIMTQLTGGANNIDIVTVKDVPNYAQLVSAGSVVNLTEIGAAPADSAAYGGLVEALTVDGALYALPFRTDFWVVYYNKDLFDAAGIAYPTNDLTWEQFDALARQLTSGFGANKVYGAHLHTWRSTVQLPAIQSGEHTLVSTDYSFLAPWYERALSLQKDGVIQSYGSLKATNTHYSGPFYNQQIAMMPMGTWFIGTQIAKVASGESLAKNWGIISYPHPEGVEPGSTAGQVTSLAINKNSTKIDAALDFIKFATGPEGAAIVAATGTIPAIRDEAVITTITGKAGFPTDEASAAALKTSNVYLELPVDLRAAQVELVLNRVHDELMTDNISIENGIAAINEGVGEILKK